MVRWIPSDELSRRDKNRLFEGSFNGHGWFRTTDLSRVKRPGKGPRKRKKRL